MINFLKTSGVFISLILSQSAYATVLTLDETGNYVISESIESNFIAPIVEGEETLQIEISSNLSLIHI